MLGLALGSFLSGVRKTGCDRWCVSVEKKEIMGPTEARRKIRARSTVGPMPRSSCLYLTRAIWNLLPWVRSSHRVLPRQGGRFTNAAVPTGNRRLRLGGETSSCSVTPSGHFSTHASLANSGSDFYKHFWPLAILLSAGARLKVGLTEVSALIRRRGPAVRRSLTRGE